MLEQTARILRPAITVMVLLGFCTGCATVNFSANYYTPPAGYQAEVRHLFGALLSRFKLGNAYAIRIVSEEESKGLKGIPAISNKTVILPDSFIKYVFQNYYNDRAIIFTCIIVHELCHDLFNLPSSPPEEHVKTDVHAIAFLGPEDAATAQYYYQSLRVVKGYWFARKGMAGHALNVGWNALSAASMAFGGPGVFVDWYATDLTKRMQWLASHYGISSASVFTRSRSVRL